MMKLAAYFIFLCCAVVKCHYAIPRIVGGHPAEDGKYPYMVSLRESDYPNKNLCGGTIISNRWILTSAFCLQFTDSIKVVAGTNHIKENGSEQVYYSEYTVSHNNSLGVLDIGLIRVSKDIEFNDRVQPVKLPTEDFNKIDEPVIMLGWGYSGIAPGVYPDELQEVTFTIMDQDKCKKIWKDHKPIPYDVTPSHICTISRDAESFCAGDDGGPLLHDGVQIGVVDHSDDCNGLLPNVYFKVYTFLDWIAAELAKF